MEGTVLYFWMNVVDKYNDGRMWHIASAHTHTWYKRLWTVRHHKRVNVIRNVPTVNSLCTVLSSIFQLSVTYYRINMWASVFTKVHACMSCLINQWIVKHFLITLHKKGQNNVGRSFPFSILCGCNLQGKMTNSNWQRRRAVSCPYILNRGRGTARPVERLPRKGGRRAGPS